MSALLGDGDECELVRHLKRVEARAARLSETDIAPEPGRVGCCERMALSAEAR